MPRTRALLIAPYPELCPVADEVSREYPELDLTILTGDLESGLRETLQTFQANYDVVVSRGGTAQMLSEEVSLPVVEIELSVVDVARQLRDLAPRGDRVAIVGFANALGALERALDLLPEGVRLFPVDFSDEVPLTIERIGGMGFDLVLCDTVSRKLALSMGLEAELLASGADSLRSAFENALFHCRHWGLERERGRMLWEIAKNQPGGLVIYLRGGGLVFSNLGEDEGVLYPFLERHLLDRRSRRLAFRRAGRVWNICPISVETTEEPIVAFAISSHEEPFNKTSAVGIDYLDREEVRRDLEQSFFYMSGAWRARLDEVRSLAGSGRPLLLRGEVGTGKEHLARLAYLESPLSDMPLVFVDLELLGERGLRFLEESYHSPLFDGRQLVFLRGIHALERQDWHDLLAAIIQSRADQRDFIVISGNDADDGSQSEAAQAFSERLKCQVLETPPLREDGTALLDAADGYLAALAGAGGVAGKRDGADVAAVERGGAAAAGLIEPGAQDQLLRASWPRNYYQLQKVLDRAWALSGGETIDEARMREAIAHEQVRDDAGVIFSREGIDLLKPLAQTEREIASLAVLRCEGNKSLAARMLQISRTTLWRMLSREG